MKIARQVTKTPAKPKDAPVFAGYDPEKSAVKGKNGWWAKTTSGDYFPSPFKTKKAAIERARFHAETMAAIAKAK